ncbi:EexN family lipoprotein [Sulfurospirillum deleyianum]|uniref:Lipoprotein n=1 Tax=Sulfurospirillum deleyianum (strain ATCC 51133 / DSM 6946 / 5175) TaxID=525898 RepID=D1B134_SULD5|nr:EexN family lipoprotein [Sulfurospirillum deleyianum]ACZ11804.1 hypothetical protein Sdel_0771 [Sulfurospirillum deleyianum DSM 6946]
MRKIILSTVFVAIVFSLTGCGSEEVKTVEYYKTHIAERDAKIKECLNNPGASKENANCANAASAKFHSGIEIDPSKATDAKKFDKF